MALLLDFQYYGKLLNWKQVSPVQAFSLTKLLRKHHGYLTPELVALSLFDQHVPAEVRQGFRTKKVRLLLTLYRPLPPHPFFT